MIVKRKALNSATFALAAVTCASCAGGVKRKCVCICNGSVAMEYLLTHRGGRGQSFDYELLYNGEGKSGDNFIMGLLDVAQLKENKISLRQKVRGVKLSGFRGAIAASTREGSRMMKAK